MTRRVLTVILFALTALPFASAQDQKKRKIEIEDLFKFKRLADPQISPDGKWVAYTVTSVSLKKNNSSTDIWLVSTAGGKPEHLTKNPKYDGNPRWSPDGKKLLFVSGRSGTNQLWVMDVGGKGKARQLTTIATGAEEPMWSPDGKWIAYVSSVWPEYSQKPFKESNALNKKRMDRIQKSPVKARIHTRLFFRHWNHYLQNKRRHLFVIPSSGGEPRDVTPGNRDADPLSFTFSSGDDFTFSPDSKYLFFTAAPAKGEAWNTNHDICRVPITGGKIETVTKNTAADGMPRVSPDRKWFAWRAQSKPGYEADRWQLWVAPYDRSKQLPNLWRKRSLTAEFDASVDQFTWFGDKLLFLAEKHARVPVWQVTLDGTLRPIVRNHSHRGFSVNTWNPRSGKIMKLALARTSMTAPNEIIVRNVHAGKEVNLTRANEQILANLDLPEPESVLVRGAGGTPMQMWIVKPPNFDPKKKWPLIYMVHGGPQGAWTDSWHYRWNPQIWAAQGYVVALPNPRGSTGFGQKYVEEISRDWGGKVYIDLMKGMDFLEKKPYIDTKRMAAAGASYGGYMMNWFQGHTDRFKTLVCHAGVYNLESMYGTTEELWFVEWDVGGKPWTNPEAYRKFSPHRFAKNFKTPMLIIHGEKDYRVPVSQGMEMFTTLQRLGVPSKMIVFPDEGHFVSKPRNSQFWHRQIFRWIAKYAPPGGR